MVSFFLIFFLVLQDLRTQAVQTLDSEFNIVEVVVSSLEVTHPHADLSWHIKLKPHFAPLFLHLHCAHMFTRCCAVLSVTEVCSSREPRAARW